MALCTSSRATLFHPAYRRHGHCRRPLVTPMPALPAKSILGQPFISMMKL
jgi:hypothetical protein